MLLLFDLRATEGRNAEPEFAPWPLTGAVALVTAVRDRAAARLKKGLPGTDALIERVLIGRDAAESDKAARVRITPVPSVGHAYADHAIRRVLVEIPPNWPLGTADIEWCFSGLDLGTDYESGEILRASQPVLVPASDTAMLSHYGIGERDGSLLWRTVTPAALPQSAGRRRINPSHPADPRERKGAKERLHEEQRAAAAVAQALRHAGVIAKSQAIRVQREPFEAKGVRAVSFAPQTLFSKERLWHVEIAFSSAMHGPLIIGDGRYLGLGLMEPVRDSWRDVLIFSVPLELGIATADAATLLRAVPRALMALSRSEDGTVPRLFSAHEADGRAAGSGQHEHVFLACADQDGDGIIERLIVAAPWACDRSARSRRRERARFDRIVSSLELVRAGALGVIKLNTPVEPCPGDGLVGPAPIWKTNTPYQPTRHARSRKELRISVSEDIVLECGRRGLPRPVVELLGLTSGPNGGGISARVRLRFNVAVEGPVLLGRDSHSGRGLFLAESA